MVAVYDVIIKAARTDLPVDETTTAFIKELVRLQLFCARTVVDGLAEELSRLQSRRKAQESGVS
jgi:hypothetical protein